MADETVQTSLKQLIQSMMGDGVQVLQGIVKSASPLKIQMLGDDKLMIGQNITYVPRHLTDHTIEVTVSLQTEDTSDSSGEDDHAIITVHNALKVGDRVHVLSFHHGKQYFVLDRVG